MLQLDTPDTYILATNRTETVGDFLTMAFKAGEIPLDFKGVGENEVGFDPITGDILVRVNPQFYRPVEVEQLTGDPTQAKNKPNWAAKTTLEELCQMMVNADIERNEKNFSF